MKLVADTEAGDFIPPQHDPAFIFLIEEAEHDQRTFGRKPGAAKTVTTRGSDVGERARTRRIVRREGAHKKRMAAKEPGQPRDCKSRWPKRKLQSRGWQRRKAQ